MIERSGLPTEPLFDASPTPTVIYHHAEGQSTARMNRAATALLEADDGRSATVLAALGQAARGESEPLRRAGLVLPHLPDRLYTARALPLDRSHTAVFIDDVTEAYAWRTSLSVCQDIVDRLDDAFVVCAVPDRRGDPRELPVTASNARAQSRAGVEPYEPGGVLGDLLHRIFTDADYERLAATLSGRGDPDHETSWRIERDHRAWNCQIWWDGRQLTIRLADVTEKGHLARALSDHARLLRATNDELDEVMHVLRDHVRAPMREARRLLMPTPDSGGEPLAPRDRRRLHRVCSELDRLLDELVTYIGITRTPLTGGTVDLERVLQRVLSTPEFIGAPRAAIDAGPLPTVWGQERLFETLFRQLLVAGLAQCPDRSPGSIAIASERREQTWRITMSLRQSTTSPEVVESLLKSGRLGHGMGLAICRRIVEHHGGRIGTTSSDDATELFFDLPPARPFG